MKWTTQLGAAALMLGFAASAPAGLLGDLFSNHSGHGNDCCPQGGPAVVARPCEKTYTYQREVSNLRPPCCNEGCAPGGECAPAGECAPGAGCAPSKCDSGWRHRKGALLDRLCDFFERDHKICDHGPDCGDAGCANAEGACAGDACAGTGGSAGACGDPCEIAELIYQARTACYAKDRDDAVDDLGEYDCRCHPEIMATLIYSLNDCDEKVRSQAADEIGDLIEDGRCCCSKEVVTALTCALSDCDWMVRRQAEDALGDCGYEIAEGCRGGACAGACQGNEACHSNPVGRAHVGPVASPQKPGTPAPAQPKSVTPAPAQEAAPAPNPPKKAAEPKPDPAEKAPAPKKAEEAKEAAPAPPVPEAAPESAPEAAPQADGPAPKAAPAPAPPEDAEAYFPSRYRR